MATERSPVVSRPVTIAQLAVLLLLGIKLYLSISAPPIGDEAYYWMWGQKLGWSYFDHPPLHAWLLRLMGTIFGWNLFSLRILTWATLIGDAAIFWAWAKRLQPDDPAAWFWPSAAIFLASPLFLLMSSIAFHDHLLIFLCLLSAHLFLLFTEKWTATGRGFAWLYAAAAALGLAVLTKYNGVLLGVAVAVFFAARRETRPLYRSLHLYLAALLSIALQAPVFYWNLTEGLASYKFHLSERWGGNISLTGNHLPEFVLVALIVVSPFLFPSIYAVIRRPAGSPFADRARGLALSALVVSTLTMAGIASVVQTFFYWNITGFVLLMPLLAGWMRRRWVFAAHAIYGILFAIVLAFNATIIPIANLTGGYDWTFSSSFGWPAVAERVKALEATYKVGFVAAARYTTAAQLGFAIKDPEVTAIADRPDQYHLWFDPAAHAGENALVISDPQLGLAEIAPHFDGLTLLETVENHSYGHTIYVARIYLGTNYHSR